jgi:hypothetical protein
LITEAPAEPQTPRSTDHREETAVDTTTVADARTKRMCAVLREAEERYRNELLEDEERQLLLDRIKRLRKILEA